MATKTRNQRISWLERFGSMLEQREPSSVLVIDNDRHLRNLLAAVLREEGYRVIEANDVTDVFDRFRLNQGNSRALEGIDLIVTDVRTTGMSGIEFIKALREREWATSVIVVSEFQDELIYAEAERLGAEAVLTKPFGLEEFLNTVHRVAPFYPNRVRPASNRKKAERLWPC